MNEDSPIALPSDVTFVVWPGWRTEEIAESLPTSGLDITPDDFVAAAFRTGARLGGLPRPPGECSQ